MTRFPEVTVLMPVCNGERFIRSAIDSVLSQTFHDFELLVVNDASTDESRAIAASFADPRIRIIDNDRTLGIGPSLNRGLGAARGSLVARLDADDISYPERLRRQHAFLDKHPRVALVGAQGDSMDDRGRFLGRIHRACEAVTLRWYQLWDSPFPHTAVMFRREIVWNVLGGYDPEFDYAEDHELWSRVLRDYDAVNLPDRLYAYRVHGQSWMERITGDPEGSPRRVGFERAFRRVIARNLETVFGAHVKSDCSVLMSRFVTGLDAASVGPFLALFRQLRRGYEVLQPSARRSTDFRRTLAWQYDAIAARLTGTPRRLAVRVYASALMEDPGLARWLPWPRALARTTVGGLAGRRLRASLRPA